MIEILVVILLIILLIKFINTFFILIGIGLLFYGLIIPGLICLILGFILPKKL